MSPDEGFSTFIMLNAILDEGYGDEIDFFKSYDLQNKLRPETLDKISNFNFFTFFGGDASKNISFDDNGIDFFFIDSDHSKSFAEWYVDLLPSVKYFFVHDIDPSEEYHIKFRPDNQNVYCGGEPLVIYNLLRNLGFEYLEKKISYLSEYYPETQLGEYKSIWTHQDPEKKSKIFWSSLEQVNFYETLPQVKNRFKIYNSPITGNQFFASNQSLFVENSF
jgi:hypothetical protein